MLRIKSGGFLSPVPEFRVYPHKRGTNRCYEITSVPARLYREVRMTEFTWYLTPVRCRPIRKF